MLCAREMAARLWTPRASCLSIKIRDMVFLCMCYIYMINNDTVLPICCPVVNKPTFSLRVGSEKSTLALARVGVDGALFDDGGGARLPTRHQDDAFAQVNVTAFYVYVSTKVHA